MFRLFRNWWVRGLGIIFLLGLVALLLLPVVAKYGLKKWLIANGADTAIIDSISYNPFESRLRMQGLTVKIGEQTLLSNGNMMFDLGFKDLFKRDIHIEQSTYDKFQIKIEQSADGVWRIGSYSLKDDGEPETPNGGTEKAGVPWIFSADRVLLTNCLVDFKTPDVEFSLAIERAELADFSTMSGDDDGWFELSGTLNGEAIYLKINSLEVSPELALAGVVKVENFQLAEIEKLLQDSLPKFEGKVGLDGAVEFKLSAQSGVAAQYDGAISLAELIIGNAGFEVDSSAVSWKGNLLFNGPPGGKSDIKTDGTLALSQFALNLPETSLAAGIQQLELAGKTAVGVGAGVQVTNDGTLALSSVSLDMATLKYAQDSLKWNGQVVFDGEAGKVATSGKLDGEKIDIAVNDGETGVRTGVLRIEGDTDIGFAAAVKVESINTVRTEDIEIVTSAMKLAEDSLVWDGRVVFDGEAGKVATSGKLDGENVDIAVNEGEIGVRTANLSVEGDTDIGFMAGVQVESSSTIQSQELQFEMSDMALVEHFLLWDGLVKYTAETDTSLVQVDGGLRSGPFEIQQGELKGGYQRFDIGSIKGDIGRNLVISNLVSDQLEVALPGEMPLGVSARQLDMEQLGTQDFATWHVGSLGISEIKGVCAFNDKAIFGLSRGEVKDIEANSGGDVRVGQILLTSMGFLQKQADKGKNVGTVGSVGITDLSYSSAAGVNVKDAEVKDLDLNVVRDKEGNISISTLLAQMKERPASSENVPAENGEKVASQAPEEDKPASKSAAFRLESFHLEGESGLVFVDYTLPLPFTTNLGIDQFTIDGLDSAAPDKRAKVDFRGELEGRAPVEIKGDIAPFGEKPAMQFTMNLKNYPLSSLSPYTVQAVGTALASGMLKLDSTMSLENDYLDLDNDVELKKLETKTISAELAAELNNQLPIPLDAALSILRDSERNISLNIPLKGPVSDLSVGISDVIITALGKAIVPAASSYLVYSLGPYGALAYVGMKVGEKMLEVSLPPVVYEAGEITVPDGQDDYLSRVAKILSERPGTDLQICPLVVRNELEKSVQEEQISAAVEENAANQPAVPQEQETAANPDSAEPAVSDEQLLQLGQQRAEALQQYLAEKHGVEKTRLLVCETTIATDKDAQPSVLLQL